MGCVAGSCGRAFGPHYRAIEEHHQADSSTCLVAVARPSLISALALRPAAIASAQQIRYVPPRAHLHPDNHTPCSLYEQQQPPTCSLEPLGDLLLTLFCLHSSAATTQKLTPADSYKILVEQRKHRPTSPHLTIYRPQITWYLSALNRITGCILSGTFYLFGISYLVAPVLGWHLESASIAAAVASWPLFVKVAAKMTLAFPFTFHAFNGLRHLTWDMGKQIKNIQVIRTGWAVVGVSVVSALFLALGM